MIRPLTIRFQSTQSDAFRVSLSSPDSGDAAGSLTLPYDAATRRAIWRALTPNYRTDAPGKREKVAVQDMLTQLEPHP